MTITRSRLPEDSALNTRLQKYDYVDSFQGVLNDPGNNIIPTDLGKAFFSSAPGWIEKLFALRNRIVSVFGLKTPDGKDRQSQLDQFKCEPGEQLGLFRVYSKSSNEVILGEDDKHLNFRVSLFLGEHNETTRQKTVTVSTTVTFNNRFGRFYFIPVRPFHKLIVPTMLWGIIKNLGKKGKR